MEDLVRTSVRRDAFTRQHSEDIGQADPGVAEMAQRKGQWMLPLKHR